ncbi:hypothetical protein [Vibrio genomosp. F10]|uniref:Uncharacterized protein n=1 Tax=Vibrio genomosp. F10 TaxID=723171 RepID=A0A1B9R347_9VIBR|nr:hypothetical protein [Vibrio genomosp. F10]OCH78592.1 hypothetical protein A6E14_17220 [Vibrio genomosp. F10]
MLEKTNEYFLRGIALAFVIKLLAVWYLASNEEEYFTIIFATSLALLLLQCTTAVYFHYLAMKMSALGYKADSKGTPILMGALSVHGATFFDNSDWIQNLNGITQVLIGLGFVAFMAFFSTYNAQKREKASIVNK